jgi:hypothetical protein
MKAELARRESLTDALERCLKSQPGVWLSMSELAAVGGLGGWRTRLSELRRLRSMHIEHNGMNGSKSRHRYLPWTPLARDASEYTTTLPLFDQGHPRA